MVSADESKFRFSVIVPAYNESARITRTLEDLAENFSDAEVVVVVNHSTDDTADIVRRFAATCSAVRLIEVAERVGKGGAVKIGMLSATGAIVGFVDADGATSAAELRRLCVLAEKHGAVIGSRWIKGAVLLERQPLSRRVASRVFNTITRLLFGMPYHDTQCGAKAFEAETLFSVLGTIDTANLAFDVDLLYALQRSGIRVHEEPTEWCDRSGSKVGLAGASVKMLSSIVRLRLRYSFLRIVVPLFDRVLPTHPVRQHDWLNVLIFNWRDVQNPRAGGAEQYLHQIARRWVQKGHTVEWVTAGFPGAAPSTTIDGITVHRVGNRFTVYFLAPLFYLRKLRDRFDIILDSENGVPFFTPFFSLKKKLLVIYHVHKSVFQTQLPGWISWFFVFVETRFMPFVYRNVQIVTISQDSAQEIVREKIASIEPPIVSCGFDGTLHPVPETDVPTIVYLGRLNRYKHVDYLIRAMVAIRAAVPNARLEIAGTGPDRETLEALVRELHLEDAVVFLGFIADDEKSTLLGRAWLFGMASEKEGFGISIVEANACGTPSVAFSAPAVRETVVHGVTGILVSSVEEYERSAIALLLDHARRREMGAAAIVHARAFTWERAAEDMFGHAIAALIDAPVHLVRDNNEWTMLKRGGGLGRRLYELEAHDTQYVMDRPSHPQHRKLTQQANGDAAVRSAPEKGLTAGS